MRGGEETYVWMVTSMEEWIEMRWQRTETVTLGGGGRK
jgi:hypothetical protein